MKKNDMQVEVVLPEQKAVEISEKIKDYFSKKAV